MALQKAALKQQLKAGFIQVLSNPQTQNNVNTVSDQLAQVMSDAIDDYVKQGNAVGTDSNGDTHALTIE